MKRSNFIRTIKDVAGARSSFLLSEIAGYLDTPISVEGLYHELLPHLPALGLWARKAGNDYEIAKIPPANPYLLSSAEEQRIAAFLAGRTFPPALERAIEAYIGKKTGKEWTDPVTLERLRRAIIAQKTDYWKVHGRRRLRYTKGYAALGYLAYHFPVYFLQMEHLLAMLARDGLLKPSMTILDVGTGPGVVPLAIADFWSRLDHARTAVFSVEQSEEHIEAFVFLRDRCTKKGAPASIKPPVKGDITGIESLQIPTQVDLMIFSNVLNELNTASHEERADLVMMYAERLAPDGTILIVEPADKENSTRMRALSIALENRGLAIYRPCSFIAGSRCDPARCWSFVSAPPISPTRLMDTLAACVEPFRYVNTDIKYSYAILRKDGKRGVTYHIPARSKSLVLANVHLHVGKRINVIVAKMSEELGDAKTHLFLLCDGTSRKPVYAVLPAYHTTPANKELLSMPCGLILELQNVLVRYNKAHDAYNLLVNRNTRIAVQVQGDRAHAP
jgi:SAM-dependent methyltransferase